MKRVVCGWSTPVPRAGSTTTTRRMEFLNGRDLPAWPKGDHCTRFWGCSSGLGKTLFLGLCTTDERS